MARTLPEKISIFGYNLILNPGPFNTKEHMLIGVCAGTSGNLLLSMHVLYFAGWSAYAIDIIAVQRLFYNQVSFIILYINL